MQKDVPPRALGARADSGVVFPKSTAYVLEDGHVTAIAPDGKKKRLTAMDEASVRRDSASRREKGNKVEKVAFDTNSEVNIIWTE